MIPALKKNDKVILLATAKKINPDDIAFATQLLQSKGYEVLLGKHLFDDYHQFAGNDYERRFDLQAALDNPEIKAIFCARGGYGTSRIIDAIDFSAFKQSPKWIIGYSDITALQNHVLVKTALPSVHATMPINMPNNTSTCLDLLFDVLSGKTLHYPFESHPLNRFGTAEGILFGGNLSLMYSLNNTVSFPDPKGKILFLEDLDEYLYHIDRMLLNLKRSKVLQQISGLVVGQFSDMRDNPIPFGKTAEEIIAEHCDEYGFPIAFNFPAGHVDNNCPLIIGQHCELIVTDKGGTLHFQ